MKKQKKLTKKQLAVLDDLFSSELDEQAVLAKFNVSKNLYYKWLADECFAEQFDRLIAAVYRQSAVLLARYATLAAAKLVQLTDSENQETARKACLDIIAYDGLQARERPKNLTPDPRPPTPDSTLSPETASKILEVLAQEKEESKNQV